MKYILFGLAIFAGAFLLLPRLLGGTAAQPMTVSNYAGGASTDSAGNGGGLWSDIGSFFGNLFGASPSAVPSSAGTQSGGSPTTSSPTGSPAGVTPTIGGSLPPNPTPHPAHVPGTFTPVPTSYSAVPPPAPLAPTGYGTNGATSNLDTNPRPGL